jgi:hypothetical protein
MEVDVIDSIKRGESKTEMIFKGIIAEDFPKLRKDYLTDSKNCIQSKQQKT